MLLTSAYAQDDLASSALLSVPESLLNEVENGSAESAYFIATQFNKQSDSNEKLYNKAKEWMQKAADMGYPQAMFELAQMFDYEKSEVNALEWFLKASEFGHSDAIYNVANYYIRGFAENPIDCQTAYVWYEKAQKKDHIVAYNDHAWSLATSADEQCRNPERAVRVFAKVQSHYRFNNQEMPLVYLDTQAAIHAGVSDFSTAIRLQQEVVDGLGGDKTLIPNYVKRLESYKKRKAWQQQIE
jgi:TPR repeat protein